MMTKSKIIYRALAGMVALAMVFAISFNAFAYGDHYAVDDPVEYSNPAEVSNDVAISSEEALEIAMAFIHDYMILIPDTKWTNETEIQDIVTLYDVDNNITGYSVELSADGAGNGYVIVSAYDDVDLIMEYSDETDPLYKLLEPDEDNETILYTDTLEYYIINDEDEIIDLNQREVDEEDITNSFESMGNQQTRERNLMVLAEVEENASFVDDVVSGSLESPEASGVGSDGTIINPFDWLGGGYTAYQWNNPYEQYCSFWLMSRFNGLPGSVTGGGHCGATALTNIMYMQRNCGDFPSAPSAVNILFGNVGQRWNTATATSYSGQIANNWIEDCYSSYGRTAWASYVRFTGSGTDNNNIYGYVRTCIDRRHPLWIDVQAASNTAYNYNGGAHAVAGYAYTRLQNDQTGYFSSFIKVMDGWHASGRYLAMGSFRGRIHEINLR